MKTTQLTITTICILVFATSGRAAELYVPGDYATIQAAIDAAYDGDTVIVADGTYTGEGNRDIDFLGKAIIVRSKNGPENCTIDCNGTPNNPHRGFYFHNGENSNSLLDGITITNGYSPTGGAILCLDSSPTIGKCMFNGNLAHYTDPPPEAESKGGAIYAQDSNLVVLDCVFTANWAERGGAFSCNTASPTIVNCTFKDNSGGHWGGAIYSRDANPTITNCTIVGNSARDSGGAIAAHRSELTITNCIVAGNSTAANAGGFYIVHSSAIVSNCTVSGNQTRLGAGIYCFGGTSTIANCTIVGNKAEKAAGGLRCRYYADVTTTSCIIWDNSPDQIFAPPDCNLLVTYSNPQGGWSGEGNIDADPCFVEAGYWDVNGVWVEGDYRLLAGSPCIDAGDPNYLPEPNETDLDGNARVIDGDEDGTAVVDMGAYEFWPAVEAVTKLTPQMLNCSSKGKFIKAHIILPEDIFPEDIDVNTPAVADPPDIDSEYIKLLGGDTGRVKLEIAFERQAFCDGIGESAEVEVTVTGLLTSGREFYASDTIKIKAQNPHRRPH